MREQNAWIQWSVCSASTWNIGWANEESELSVPRIMLIFLEREVKKSAGGGCSRPCSPTLPVAAQNNHMHPTGEGKPRTIAYCCSRGLLVLNKFQFLIACIVILYCTQTHQGPHPPWIHQFVQKTTSFSFYPCKYTLCTCHRPTLHQQPPFVFILLFTKVLWYLWNCIIQINPNQWLIITKPTQTTRAIRNHWMVILSNRISKDFVILS